MADISRNAPCPCGSGKKYKNCHLGKEAELSPQSKSRPIALILLTLVVLGVAGLVFMSKGAKAGAAVGAGGLMIVGIAAVILKPPPPGAGGDPGAINFGS